MADSWSVPINTAGIDALDDTIAKGHDLSFIGNLLDSYSKGQDIRNTQNQRDAFKNGLPRVDQNDPNSAIDWNAVTDTLAKTGGTSQVQNLIGLQKLDIARGLAKDDPNTSAPSNPQFPPSTSRGTTPQYSAPVSPTSQPQSSADVPTGTPAPPGQNITSGKVTGIDYGPVQTNNGGGLTPRMIASRTGADVNTIASGLGVSPDEQIDPNNPETRAKLVQTVRYTQGNPQGQPPQAQPQTQQVAQNAPQGQQPIAQPQSTQPPPTTQGPQGNINEGTAARYEAIANAAYNKAKAAAIVDPAMALQFKAQGDMAAKNAEIIRETLGKNAQTTPEIKNAGASGQPSPLAYEGTKKAQDLQIDQGQKTYAGIHAQASQYERDLKPYLDISKSILNDPKFYSGIGGKFSLDFNRVRAALGDKQAAMLQEALDKVTASSVLGQINTQRDQLQEAGGASSRIFSAQVDLVQKAAPSLANTVYGNRFLVTVAQRMGDLSSHVDEMARDYKASHKLGLDSGFDKQVSDYMRSNPVFTDQERSHPEVLGAPTVPPDISHNAQAIKQWGQSLGLKPGDAIRFPTGEVRAITQ